MVRFSLSCNKIPQRGSAFARQATARDSMRSYDDANDMDIAPRATLKCESAKYESSIMTTSKMRKKLGNIFRIIDVIFALLHYALSRKCWQYPVLAPFGATSFITKIQLIKAFYLLHTFSYYLYYFVFSFSK